MNKIYISPSILSADFANLESEIKRLEKAGADWVHIDVMDGHFVPNITIGIPIVKSLRKVTKMPLDVHLMIENPMKYVPQFIDSGADIITVHYEACENNLDEIINFVKDAGKKIGVSIKPKTPENVLDKYLDKIDMVLIMTVEPGFGGQEFMPDAAFKVKHIKEQAPKPLVIQVDGGINGSTSKLCKDLGANSLVAGSYLFKANDLNSAILSLK